ncbi:hypothetical protein Pyn_20740 [Prunus yedoensis var. nudiflora]|uniref:DUF659 domain-containing protein n=1 Tax=Prunus yedoensis var. nudiflora TaxID=2094558 RepID=A0A314U8L3_PRUYE|nr:hypothetical protein Pyn_20740 [Prunus yedoensis var. nudiflora]
MNEDGNMRINKYGYPIQTLAFGIHVDNFMDHCGDRTHHMRQWDGMQNIFRREPIVAQNSDLRTRTYDMLGIEEVGPYNVLQVVTDNARNCVTSGRAIGNVNEDIFVAESLLS